VLFSCKMCAGVCVYVLSVTTHGVVITTMLREAAFQGTVSFIDSSVVGLNVYTTDTEIIQ